MIRKITALVNVKIINLYSFLLVILVLLLFCFSFYLISLHLFQNEMMFHTDVARDFLLIEDIIKTKDITLIGPKAGGIPGMFFGPIWLYLHIPLFLMGNGNPMVIAYFWVFLIFLSVFSVFFVSFKIFGRTSAVIASLIYAFFTVTFSAGFTQTFGSVLVSPWLLYFMYVYYERKKSIFLVLALFTNGIIYQLQPAVGMITLPVTCLFSLYLILRRKKYRYLFAYLILLIPFSTYIIFDLGHDFLQVRAFFEHFVGDTPKDSKLTSGEFLENRFISFFSIITLGKITTIFNFIFLSLYGFVLYKIYKKAQIVGRSYYLLFFAYVLGFVVMTFLYRGIIINYYFWAFLPLSVIAFSGLYRIVNKFVFISMAVVVLFLSINSAITYRNGWTKSFTGVDSSSWKLNEEVARFIFNDASSNFGYYVYSPDEFGFSIKYALNYIQKSEGSKATLCQKKNETYLIYYPTPSFAKTDPIYWKKERIKLTAEPVLIKIIGPIVIEKYILHDLQIKEQADPNLVCDLFFR